MSFLFVKSNIKMCIISAKFKNKSVHFSAKKLVAVSEPVAFPLDFDDPGMMEKPVNNCRG